MFTEAYHDTFATVGIRLRSEDGCERADIEDAERHLGIKIPVSLKEYYLAPGREKRINQFHNRLLCDPRSGSAMPINLYSWKRISASSTGAFRAAKRPRSTLGSSRCQLSRQRH